VRETSTGGTSRRRLLAGLGGGALAGLAGCTWGGGDDTPGAGASPTRSAAASASPEGPLVWSNWPDYIDVRSKPPRHPTLARFSDRTGIEVDYREVIEDNATYVDSLGAALAERRPVGTDLMVLTSWMSARLVRDRVVQPLDRSRLPHTANLIGALGSPSWDPGRRYSMPWQAGLTGIAYDATKVERAVGGVGELLRRPDLRGRVGLLTEFDDTVGLVALSQGADLTDLTVDRVDDALDAVEAARRSGQVRRFYGNSFVRALTSGTIAACIAWSGDILQAQLDNPNIKFVVPEEGLVIWSDNFLVPSASVRGAQAAALIDWYYRPEVAAQVAAWVNYICPVSGAQEAMARLDPDLALSPLIFPDASILDRSFQFPALRADDDRRLRAAFAALVSRPA
jgi:spermidine/putrescine transport system substrate-binding protein